MSQSDRRTGVGIGWEIALVSVAGSGVGRPETGHGDRSGSSAPIPAVAIECEGAGIVYPPDANGADGLLAGVFVERLALPQGRLTAVIGDSGSGKSTLLSLLGSLKPCNMAAEGARLVLRVGGEESDLLGGMQPAARDVSFVFQEAHLMKALSAFANFRAGGLMAGRSPSVDDFAHYAVSCGLVAGEGALERGRDLARRAVSEFSGGQAQRIAIGRALAGNAAILFCDEPTSSLDGSAGAAVLGIIRDWIGATGGTALWVTHNIEQAAAFADDYVVTSGGRLLTDEGKPFSLGAMTQPERAASMRERRNEAAGLQPLSRELLADFGARDFSVRAGGAGGRGRDPLPARAYGFLADCVRADLFSRPRTASRAPVMPATGRGEPGDPGRRRPGVFARASRPITGFARGFSSYGMALALLVGMLALYLGAFAFQTFDRYFFESLLDPALAHFVVVGDSQSMRTDAIGRLRSDLRTAYGADPERSGPRIVYGRWRDPLASVSASPDGSCDIAGRAELVTSRMAVSPDEPLFEPLFTEAARVEGNERPAIVTRDLRDTMVERWGEENAKGFCLHGLGSKAEYFRVAGVVKALPGSGEYSYNVLIASDDLLDVFEQYPLASGYDASGSRRYPAYTNAAVYFEAASGIDMICEFVERGDPEVAKRCSHVQEREGYLTDPDALKQLQGFLGVANATRAGIGGVVAMFILSVGVTAALALQGFVMENEKFLCILKAFRYRFRHLFFMTALRSAILVAMAASASLAIIAGAHALLAVPLAGSLDVDASRLAFSAPIFGLTAICLLLLSTLVSFVVISLWWRANRYVGEKLQAI